MADSESLDNLLKKNCKLFNGTPRDPKRIRIILEKFARIWAKYPDQRFYQLVDNICTRKNNDVSTFWHIEDSEFEAELNKIISNDYKF